jgi:hypothetical protein
MGNFNFGQPFQQGHKKRVGAWGVSKRNESPITEDMIPRMVKLFFIDMATIEAMCEELDASELEVRTIITGGNFHKAWSTAVINLIADGHECARPIAGLVMRNEDARHGFKRKKAPRGRLAADVVIRVRQMHMDGSTLKHIVNVIEIRHTAVRSIIRNETYLDDKYKPEGWAT